MWRCRYSYWVRFYAILCWSFFVLLKIQMVKINRKCKLWCCKKIFLIFFKIFRFIDDLISINDGNEFENHYNESMKISAWSNYKKKNASLTEMTFLHLHLYINKGEIQTSSYDKEDSHSFNNVNFPCTCCTIPSKLIFSNR